MSHGGSISQGMNVDGDDIRKLKSDAEHGDAISQYTLGNKYKSGFRGLAKNAQESFRYYQLAAIQNHVEAQYEVGLCYLNGIGVSVNKKKAVKYFALAANQGHIQALSSQRIIISKFLYSYSTYCQPLPTS